MSQIDFQSYIALLAAEMPRFSVPGIGSFIWHVEKAHVDPKAGTVAPPRPFLKYEPGHRYQVDTVAFLQEYFGMSPEEAEAFLREIGRLASSYIRATNEMDLWKLGKIRKVGAVYKVELAEEAPVPFTAELYEVSLRSGAVSAVAPPPVAAHAPAREKQQKPAKVKEKPVEHSRARVVESPATGEVIPQPASSAGRRWGLIVVGIGVIVAVVAVSVFWVLRGRKPAQPVEVVLSRPKPDKPAQPAEPASQASSPSSAQKSVPSPAPEKPQQTQKRTASAERKPAEPSPAPDKSTGQKPPTPEKPVSQTPPPSPPKPVASGPRYHIIVGSYPSRAEAESRAREFSGYRVEYLPGKDPGWVRLSIFSSSDKAEVQQKLREVKSQVPDAWVFTAQ